MNAVFSKDGTRIAFEQLGTGPSLVLVGAALTDRAGTAKLARLLAQHFTVINYDRRGRGESTDTPPFTVEREVEDLESLIDVVGGSASLFGSSSGAVLALEAGSLLAHKVECLVLYEPPFIIDDSHPKVPDNLAEQIDELVMSNRRNDAVRLFFTKGMGIPAIFVTMMRLLMPSWSKMAAVAHTIPYDLAVLAGTQTGKPLSAQRWVQVKAPTLVLVGGRSEAFFHASAKALVSLLAHAQYRSLAGGHHGSVLLAPKDIAAVMVEFFRK